MQRATTGEEEIKTLPLLPLSLATQFKEFADLGSLSQKLKLFTTKRELVLQEKSIKTVMRRIIREQRSIQRTERQIKFDRRRDNTNLCESRFSKFRRWKKKEQKT